MELANFQKFYVKINVLERIKSGKAFESMKLTFKKTELEIHIYHSNQ